MTIDELKSELSKSGVSAESLADNEKCLKVLLRELGKPHHVFGRAGEGELDWYFDNSTLTVHIVGQPKTN
jgi:hypothetical protein